MRNGASRPKVYARITGRLPQLSLCYRKSPVSVSKSEPAAPEALAAILGGVAAELDIARSQRMFTNRNLKMSDVEVIGFDMDYTLAVYNQAALEQLSIQCTLDKMIAKKGYPPEIRDIDYKPEWAIRGLVVDRKHGNVFKMDRHGHIGRVFHGHQQLERDARRALYHKERVRTSQPPYSWIDTLFALPEVVMYSALVAWFEARGPVDFPKLWDDIREAIDEAHRDESMKRVIKADLPRFIVKDKLLAASLHKFRSSGKRLFLLTNSMQDYTEAVMKYLLDGELPAYPSWKGYFDVIIVGGEKPRFFTDKNPFLELDAAGAVIGPAKTLQRGRVYQGGNIADFEKLAGASGDRVLYVGDHIYGDILRAKKSSVWRTCMIVQELEQELETSQDHADDLTRLSELDRRQARLESELNYQQMLLKTLQKLADAESPRLPGAPDVPLRPADLEAAKKAAKSSLDLVRQQLRETLAEYDKLDDRLDQSYNPRWGALFKEGNENSRFGEQVEDYACLYTSRVSNFLAYSPLQYFRAPRDHMPHELSSSEDTLAAESETEDE